MFSLLSISLKRVFWTSKPASRKFLEDESKYLGFGSQNLVVVLFQ